MFGRLDDTIGALASPPGAAPRSIVRISGPGLLGVLAQSLTEPSPQRLAAVNRPTRLAARVRLTGWDCEVPLALLLWPGRRSYTAQPTAELHLPGSPPLVEAVLAHLSRHGMRLAEPGEFTLRAFLGGRIDLTQAEAVLGVIDAGSDAALGAALAQLAGGLSHPLAELREKLLELLAHLEAGLDFVEEDLTFIAPEELVAQVRQARASLAAIEAQLAQRGVAESEPLVVLRGRPNAGKSSLFNRLLGGQQAALVAPWAGTTRDYLMSRWRVSPRLECLLCDTAGVDGEEPHWAAASAGGASRGSAGDFDLEAKPAASPAQVAQWHSARQTARADLVLWCCDGSRPLSAWERRAMNRPTAPGSADGTKRHLLVRTKCDLPRAEDWDLGALEVSAETGQGLAELSAAVAAALGETEAGQMAAPTAARCRDSLVHAGQSLEAAARLAAQSQGEELVAIELRSALDELGRVTGAVVTDDILDQIFSRFCIGK